MMSVYSLGSKALMNLFLYILFLKTQANTYCLCKPSHFLAFFHTVLETWKDFVSKLSSDLSARQCEHELALVENNGVVDIVETSQLNPYEQAQVQRIAELQAQLAPLERQAVEL